MAFTEKDWLSTLFLLNVSTVLKGTHNYIFIHVGSIKNLTLLKEDNLFKV